MDEMAIAQSVLESILEEAAKVKLRPVAASISYGMMRRIDRETLCEAFESIARGTTCEGMSLKLTETPAQISCDSCGAESDYELWAPHCAKCGSGDFHFLPDAPIMLEDIEFKEL